MTTKAMPGNYIGKIVGHGTDTRNGLALVNLEVHLIAQMDDAGTPRAFNGEVVYCRIYLEGKTEEKSATALRMARQTLRLCGFDPDARPLSDIDDAPRLLFGNEVPVRVSENESNGKFYTNYDIAAPRGVPKDTAKTLTDRLRAAKAKDEPPMKAPPATPAATGNQRFTAEDIDRARAAGVANEKPLDDVPF